MTEAFEQGSLAEGVVEVVMSDKAREMVAKCQASNNPERWVVFHNSDARFLRDFRVGDELLLREHIQHTERTSDGLVVFLCLEDSHGALVEGSQMSQAEVAEHLTTAPVPAG